MAFVALEPLARAATIADKNICLLFLVAGMNRHDFLFETLALSGRMGAAFC